MSLGFLCSCDKASLSLLLSRHSRVDPLPGVEVEAAGRQNPAARALPDLGR